MCLYLVFLLQFYETNIVDFLGLVKIETSKKKVRRKYLLDTMFSAYSYKTLKYFGVHDIFTMKVKFSPSEQKMLQENTFENAIIQTPISITKTTKNDIVTFRMKNWIAGIGFTPNHWETLIIDWYGDGKYGGVRYVDDIIVEYTGVNPIEDLVSFTMEELEVLVQKNFGKVQGDTTNRQSWVYAYIDTVLLGFNTFAIRSQLTDDLLREIRKYL